MPSALNEAGATSSRPSPHSVYAAITRRAAAADRGEGDLGPDIAALVDSGLLAQLTRACLPGGDTLAGCDILRALGRANLSVGRLVEGHVNALRLIRLYGQPTQQSAVSGSVLHGVWGADDDPPVRILSREGKDARLGGGKRFCSGLGLVGRAVVTAQGDDGAPQMLLVDVADHRRADPTSWQVSGMRATASGRYDLEGVQAGLLGQPGDFLREPHFEGGIWRYLALHTGGLEALAEAVRQKLGTQPHPLQAARLVELVTAANTARLWTEAAALAVESPRPGPLAVTRALLARQAVETACQQGIALAERAVGTLAFASGTDIDRIRRDLAFFLRQADLDGKMQRAASALAGADQPVGEMW